MTTIFIDPRQIRPKDLAPAVDALLAGELVAFPTETVYGLRAHATNPDAVRSIFTAKGRPATNPLIVHVSSLAQARALSSAWPEVADTLAEYFWPGPLTLVVPRAEVIPDEVTAGLDSAMPALVALGGGQVLALVIALLVAVVLSRRQPQAANSAPAQRREPELDSGKG